MTFEDAVKQAVRSYFEGKAPNELDKASGTKRKYTKKYFDGIAASKLPKKSIKKVMKPDGETLSN